MSNSTFFKNLDIRKYIRNEQATDKTLLTELAKVAGYSNTTPITKWLDDYDRELEKFNSLIDILKKMFGKDVNFALEAYARTMNPSKKTTRYVLEYAKINRMDDLFNTMLEVLLSSKNKDSRKWAKYYKIDADAANGAITLLDSIQLANESTGILEMDIFTKLVQAYGYYDLKNYSMLMEVVKTMEYKMDEIEDEFIRNSYTSRLLILKQGTFLFTDEIMKSRECGYNALEVTEECGLLSLVYMHLGHAYTFGNFDKANEFFIKSLEICRDSSNLRIEKEVKVAINFLRNYWSKETEYLDYDSKDISDIQEVIFNQIRKGNFDDAMVELEKLSQHELSENEIGFNYFLKGLISNNKTDYYESILHFKNIGDRFYINAPLVELQKLGENPLLLAALRA